MTDYHTTAKTEAQLGYSRPNKCGMGAHYAGAHEYRVLRWREGRGEWSTVVYTEFLDKALDHASEGDIVEEAAWRRVG